MYIFQLCRLESSHIDSTSVDHPSRLLQYAVCPVLSVCRRLHHCGETCTSPISTNPASKYVGELSLTVEAGFVVSGLELVARWSCCCMMVSLLLCILNAAGFRFVSLYFPSNAPGLRYLSGSVASFTSLLEVEKTPSAE